MQTATLFTRETIPLDGEVFTDCEFKACRLLYSGGQPPVFDNCRFDACDWKMDGEAAQTLAFLKTMWAVGGKAPVQQLIKEITGAVR